MDESALTSGLLCMSVYVYAAIELYEWEPAQRQEELILLSAVHS